MSKRVIILFGPPGAGKGTQSELLSEKMGLYLFETSKMLEREFKRAQNLDENAPDRFVEVEGGKFDVQSELAIWKRGELCSPPWVTHLSMKEFERLFHDGDSLIIAGSPRTVYEAEREMPLLEKLYGKEHISIFLLEISAEATIFRNSHRKICELMRHSILSSEETKKLKLCPIDGSMLVARKDLDDPETIKTRLQQYKDRTLPLFDYFNNNGFKVKKINGERSVAEVHYDIVNELD
ncbi:MAG TPA: nucleoside monophosphate kinase [Negativicutes bacterium]|nr:nucleoside monophosphate kinase [Negativicutes bacterium]